jgi:hypothetical protein
MTDETIDTTGEEVHEEYYTAQVCAHPVESLNFGMTDNDGNVLCTGCDSYVKNPDAPDATERISSSEVEAVQALELDPCVDNIHDLDSSVISNDGGIQCRICKLYIGGVTPEGLKLSEKQEKTNRVLELHALIAHKKEEIQSHYEELRQLTYFETEEEAIAWLDAKGFKHTMTEHGATVTLPSGQWHRGPTLMDAASHVRTSVEAQKV